jgi:hypothetical protein
MRIVTFEKGLQVRHVLRWMLFAADPASDLAFRVRYSYRSLQTDLSYRFEDDVDWYAHARDLAYAFGLVLYRDKVNRWQVRPLTWTALRAQIMKERGWK